MNTYHVEFDGINECGDIWYEAASYDTLIKMVIEDLTDMGGGHADIFDDDGDFMEDIEV